MLRDMQAAVAAGLLSGDFSRSNDAVRGDGLAPSARLQIYRNHFLLSLTAALAKTFPVLERLVGEGYFKSLCRDFIVTHPPRAPCLFEYGAELAEYCEARDDLRSYPYIPDMVRFEWAMNVAYNAAAVSVTPPLELAALAPDQIACLCFTLHPSLSLLQSSYPLAAIWRENIKPLGEEGEISLADGGDRLMIWRGADDVMWRQLSGDEYAFIQALKEGAPLPVAAARANGLDLAATLGMVLGAGIVAGFNFAVVPKV